MEKSNKGKHLQRGHIFHQWKIKRTKNNVGQK